MANEVVAVDSTEKTTVVKLDQNLSEKIIRQIEYYFSDVNLSKDKFMQEETQKDNGFVTLETLIKFNRLKVLSTDFDVIIDSLKQSKSSLLEIDEENKKVRRAKPLPENLTEFEAILRQNTVYVKGFPTTLTLDELYSFFEAHGKVLQIFMRRLPASKQFKGSVFVTFETNEQMKSFLEKRDLKYQEQALLLESQEDYLKRKGPAIESAKAAKLKKEQEKEEKKKQREEAEEAFFKEQKLPGSVLHLKGTNSECTRELIRELFDSFAKIKWVDYNKGEPEAFVRFLEANTAKDAMEKAKQANNDQLKIKEAVLEGKVLEGDEEDAFWKDVIKKMAEKKNNKRKRNNNQNNRPRRDNRNKGKKRGLDDDDEESDNNQEEATENDKKKVKE